MIGGRSTMAYVHPTDKDKRTAIEKAAKDLFQGRQKDVNEVSTLIQEVVAEKPQVH